MEVDKELQIKFEKELTYSLAKIESFICLKKEYRDMENAEPSLHAHENLIASILYEITKGDKEMLQSILKSSNKRVMSYFETLLKDFPFP